MVERGVVRPNVRWRETWHEFVASPYGMCVRCGVKADRAIHSHRFAEANNYEWVPADA